MTTIQDLLRTVEYRNASSERLLEFHRGTLGKHNLQLDDWFGAMEVGLVVRLIASSGELIDVTTHGGDLTQLRTSASGVVKKAYGMWKGEFEDHLLADKYTAQLILYDDSSYPKAESINSNDFGGGDSI